MGREKNPLKKTFSINFNGARGMDHLVCVIHIHNIHAYFYIHKKNIFIFYLFMHTNHKLNGVFPSSIRINTTCFKL